MVQPHLLATPAPPQVWPATVQLPQSSVALHPLETVPQFKLPSDTHVFAVQEPVAHWFGVLPPPPHVWPATVQLPQSRVPPQASGAVPQARPRPLHVFAAHPHWFAVVSPQVLPAGHMPQFTAWPQLLTAEPHALPAHAAVLSAMQPHLLSSPPPPQVEPLGHTPQ